MKRKVIPISRNANYIQWKYRIFDFTSKNVTVRDTMKTWELEVGQEKESNSH